MTTGADYFERVAGGLDASPFLSRNGFNTEVWGKGADFNQLLQVKHPSWRLEAVDAAHIGYEGIEVHYEACRPGHWVIHCELWPRQGKAQKAQVLGVPALLELKGGITKLIREQGARAGWGPRFGAHLKRARSDPSDPSSLIVYTFDLRLASDHSPEQFVAKVLPIVEATAPVIDQIVNESPRS